MLDRCDRKRPTMTVGPKPVKVVIFCGGLGVRMGEATSEPRSR